MTTPVTARWTDPELSSDALPRGERTGPPTTGLRVLFLVSEGWYFASHRLDLAGWLVSQGCRVTVATNVGAHGDVIRRTGCEVINVPALRRGAGVMDSLRVVPQLAALYRAVRPDVIHHVALKPVLFGGLASTVSGARCVVHAIAGFGYAFAEDDWRRRTLRAAVLVGLRGVFRRPGTRVIVQNPDDHRLVLERRLARPEQVALIRGVGVDLARFAPTPPPDGPPLVVLAARLLRDKGVCEFVEAARELRRRGVQARFALVGDIDVHNRASIARDEVARWVDEGAVEWWGHATDMPAVFAAASVVALPSYREGLPKVLIEAAACGRPIVATDVPGCREVVADGDNGLLVPPRDSAALAEALAALLGDPALRRRMGDRGRARAESEFALERVNAETFALYG